MNARVIIPDADLAQAMRETGWSEKRTEIAAELYKAGFSATMVACELGGGLTRNAVIGKMHRMGIAGPEGTHGRAVRPSSIPARMKERKPRQERVPRSEQFYFAPKPPKTNEPPPPPIIDAEIPVAQRRSLVELDSTSCHWPVGDPGAPGFFFCGAPVRKAPAGEPQGCYCRAHYFRSVDRAGDVRRRRQAQTNPIDRVVFNG